MGTVRAAGWTARPAIVEKAVTVDNGSPPPRETEAAAIVYRGYKLIHNTKRPAGAPEFELYDFYQDRLDQKNVAPEHPDQVERLAKALAAWRQWAQAARLKPDSEAAKGMTAEQLEQLRSLGYIK